METRYFLISPDKKVIEHNDKEKDGLSFLCIHRGSDKYIKVDGDATSISNWASRVLALVSDLTNFNDAKRLNEKEELERGIPKLEIELQKMNARLTILGG